MDDDENFIVVVKHIIQKQEHEAITITNLELGTFQHNIYYLEDCEEQYSSSPCSIMCRRRGMLRQ
jgi:hypothetical protein